MFQQTQKLVIEQSIGLAWAIEGHAPFAANDADACRKHAVPCIPTDADVAIDLVAGWVKFGLDDDMLAHYAGELANESDAVIARVASISPEGSYLWRVVEAAKDEIEERHLQATANYAAGY